MIHIETYRGWDISFCTLTEKFTAYSTANDIEAKKQTYAACKNHIDDFIKENQTFKPFWVVKKPSIYDSAEKILVIGKRKDNALIVEANGVKKQLSSYDEGKCIRWTPEVEELLKKYQEILDNINKAIEERSNFEKTYFTQPTLGQIKHDL